MITYNVKLDFEKIEDKSRAEAVFDAQKLCWNYISRLVFTHKPKGIKETHDLVYKDCREKFPMLPAQYIIRSYNDVKAAYKSIKSNKQTIYAPAKKKNRSIRFDKRLYTIKGNSIFFTALDGKRIQMNFSPYKKLDILLKTYRPCDPLIFIRDRQWWLSLSFRTPEPLVNENCVLGIDIGEKRIFASSENEIFIDRKFNKEKRRLRYLKRTLNSKGTKAAKKKLRTLKRKERNKNKNQVHKISNLILKTKANIIAIEDLKGIKQKTSKKNKAKGNLGKKRNNKFSQIPVAELGTVLGYKAECIGKRVVKVSPYKTSQEDYRGIKQGIRKKIRYYGSDGVILDSDINAAINIAQKHAKNQLPVSFGNFPVAGLDGQALVSGPEAQADLCKSMIVNSEIALQAPML